MLSAVETFQGWAVVVHSRSGRQPFVSYSGGGEFGRGLFRLRRDACACRRELRQHLPLDVITVERVAAVLSVASRPPARRKRR